MGKNDKRIKELKLSFGHYYCGSFNRDALAGCRELLYSHGLGNSGSIFVAGKVGTGKTYLFQAVKEQIENFGGRVLMVSGEKIGMSASKGKKISLKSDSDFLMIDQVEGFRPFADAHGEAFFELLSEFRDKAIFLNGDSSPSDFPFLKEWWSDQGHRKEVFLEHPDYEERIAILKQINHDLALGFESELCDLIGKQSNWSFRQMSGLTKVCQLIFELYGPSISVGEVGRILRQRNGVG